MCAEREVPVVPQGGNTGLVGGATPSRGRREVVISLERLNRVREIDPLNFTITVEAGCILESVHAAAAAENCIFPLQLGAQGSCQIGGNIATNAGGLNVLRYGMMRDLVLGLEAVLPDGRTWNGLHKLRKNNMGYDLKQLFLGSEGTLGVVTAACLKLFPRPTQVETAILAVHSAATAVQLLGRAAISATSFRRSNCFPDAGSNCRLTQSTANSTLSASRPCSMAYGGFGDRSDRPPHLGRALSRGLDCGWDDPRWNAGGEFRSVRRVVAIARRPHRGSGDADAIYGLTFPSRFPQSRGFWKKLRATSNDLSRRRWASPTAIWATATFISMSFRPRRWTTLSASFSCIDAKPSSSAMLTPSGDRSAPSTASVWRRETPFLNEPRRPPPT
jgi:FAD binding domain